MRLRYSTGVRKRAMNDTLALLSSESYQFVRFQEAKIRQLKATNEKKNEKKCKSQLIENYK